MTLEVHLPYAHSLKDKRQVLRSLKDRLRSHFNVAVAEVDHQELWQRATIGVVSISNEQAHVSRLLERVEEEAEKILNGGLANSEIEIY